MSERFAIPTEDQSLTLCQMMPSDALPFFAAHDRSRENVLRFNPHAIETFPTLESVESWIAQTTRGNRMVLWKKDRFAGYAEIRPDEYEGETAEIGYWMDDGYTGKGYATLAVKAITAHYERLYSQLSAVVMIGNIASERVLEKAGYRPGSPFPRRGIWYRPFIYPTEPSKTRD